MSPIIFLILRVSIPAGIGFAIHEALKGKLGRYAPGAAAHSAYLGFVISGLILGAINGHFSMSTFEILLFLVSIAGLVWLIAQPGLPAAGLLIARHAYAAILVLIDVPKLFKFGFYFWPTIFTLATLAFSVLTMVFLAMTLQEKR